MPTRPVDLVRRVLPNPWPANGQGACGPGVEPQRPIPRHHGLAVALRGGPPRRTQVDFAGGEIRLDPGTTKTGERRVFPLTSRPAPRRHGRARLRPPHPLRLLPRARPADPGVPQGVGDGVPQSRRPRPRATRLSPHRRPQPPAGRRARTRRQCSWSAGGHARCSTATTSWATPTCARQPGSSTRRPVFTAQRPGEVHDPCRAGGDRALRPAQV